MDWRKHLRGRPALVAGGLGVVLTFLVTVGKMVEPRVLLMRYLLNAAVFYALGVAAAWMWERLTSSLEEGGVSGPATPSESPAVPETSETSEMPEAPVGKAEEGGAEPLAEEGAAEVQATAAKTSPHTDFEIRDEYIVIKDRKIPNDPKLMAQAIKTKIAE